MRWPTNTTGIVDFDFGRDGRQQFIFTGVTSVRNTVNIDGADGFNQYVINLNGENANPATPHDNIIDVHRSGDRAPAPTR